MGAIQETVLRTLAMPEIARIRATLVPEYTIYTEMVGALLAGRVDAVMYADGHPAVVVDWKSDVNPSAADRELYAAQMQDYLDALAAKRGAIVYMSRSEIQWVERDSQ
jgi:ATP-dependent exoDNAse (exonuclease V) beta subunit